MIVPSGYYWVETLEFVCNTITCQEKKHILVIGTLGVFYWDYAQASLTRALWTLFIDDRIT